mgnify:CR=1 FL=1|jgi:hypothetical protein
MTTIPFDDPRWKASPAPNTPLSITKDKLVLKANKGTDWWRNQERNSTDGVVYGFEVDVSKGIEVSVELDIHHKDRVRVVDIVSVLTVVSSDEECQS